MPNGRSRAGAIALVVAMAASVGGANPAAATTSSTTITLPSVVGLAISPDGTRLYAASPADSTIRVFDTATNAQVGSVSVGNLSGSGDGAPFEIVLTTDGSSLVAGDTVGFGGMNIVVLIDTATLTVAGGFPVAGLPRSLAADLNGPTVYVGTTGANCTVDAIDIKTANISSDSIGIAPCDMAWVAVSLSGLFAVADFAGNQIKATGATIAAAKPTWVGFVGKNGIDLLWTDNGGEGKLQYNGSGSIGTIVTGPAAHVAISPDLNTAYITNFQTRGEVVVVDLVTKAVTARIPVGANPNDIVVSPRGDRLYVANQGVGTISVIDVNGSDPAAELGTTPLPIPALTLAPTPNPDPLAAPTAALAGLDPLLVAAIALLVLMIIVVIAAIAVIARRRARPAPPEQRAIAPPAAPVTQPVSDTAALNQHPARQSRAGLVVLMVAVALVLIALTVVVTLLLAQSS